MFATGLLLVLLLVATATDLRRHTISNWLTYPGILAGLGLNAAGTLVAADEAQSVEAAWPFWGLVGGEESLLGLAVCGGLMLVAFVFFPGVGGGDVKLMAMVGAFLGYQQGLETLLWTFVLAGAFGLIVLAWRVGALRLIGRVWRHAICSLRVGGWSELEPDERQQLQFPTSLAPMTLAAVLIALRNREIATVDWIERLVQP